MRKYQPSSVDWPAIRERIEAGEGFTSVAKDYDITRQAIQNRCKREAWIEHKPATTAIRRRLHKRNKAQPVAVQQDETPQPDTAAKMSAVMLAREDKQSASLELLAEGLPRKHVAQAVGIGEATLLRWINDDELFGADVRAAESAAVLHRLRRIEGHGKRDWRADSWFLERTQRDTFGSDAGKGGGVAVQINIQRNVSDATEAVVIDGKS